MADPDLDQNVQVFKIKRLIRNLEKARGNGTSMISLIIPPKEQVAKQQKVLTFYYSLSCLEKPRFYRPLLSERIFVNDHICSRSIKK